MENPTDEEIEEILKSAKNIAVVGCRISRGGIDQVAAYLKTGSPVMDRCVMQEHKRLLARVGR